jgi:hypothetical protein
MIGLPQPIDLSDKDSYPLATQAAYACPTDRAPGTQRARYFGFPTCWINRGGSIFEEIGQAPDWQLRGLDGVPPLFDTAGPETRPG